MKVELTRLHRIESEGSLKAFADICLDDDLLVKGLRIVEGKNGLFVSMPREKGRDNRWYEMIHPLNKEIKEQITSCILKGYEL